MGLHIEYFKSQEDYVNGNAGFYTDVLDDRMLAVKDTVIEAVRSGRVSVATVVDSENRKELLLRVARAGNKVLVGERQVCSEFLNSLYKSFMNMVLLVGGVGTVSDTASAKLVDSPRGTEIGTLSVRKTYGIGCDHMITLGRKGTSYYVDGKKCNSDVAGYITRTLKMLSQVGTAIEAVEYVKTSNIGGDFTLVSDLSNMPEGLRGRVNKYMVFQVVRGEVTSLFESYLDGQNIRALDSEKRFNVL